jgi:hypothetical protein
MTEDVKWAYFFCHEYVSSESSFFSSLRAGLFAAAGRKSEKKKKEITAFFMISMEGKGKKKSLHTFNVPCRCRIRRKFDVLRR